MKNQMPFFGICLGMQLAVIEYARTVMGWKDAESRGFNDKSKHLVIDLMDEQRNVTDKVEPCVWVLIRVYCLGQQSTTGLWRH